MANLSDLFGGGDAGTTTLEEAKPTFGVFSGYNGGTYSSSTVNESGIIAGGFPNSSSEGWNNFNGQQYTQSSIGSGGDGNTAWFQATPNMQAEGHYRYIFPTDGWNYANVLRHASNSSHNYWPYFGTVIGPEGFRQKISIWNQNSDISIFRRGAYRMEYLSLSNGTTLNTSGEPSNTSFGMNSYNSRINRLALVRGDSNNNYRLHVWTNPNINLNREDFLSGDLYNFLRQAYLGENGASYFYNDFSWSTSGSSSYNESRYHMRIVLSDDGKVGIARMTPSNQTVSGFLVPNPAGTSPTTNISTLISLSLTTSYGIEQGTPYGMRSNINWDNSAVICYSPYYYYASGINMHIFSTKDASKIGYYQDSSSSWGIATFPIGKSSFGIHNNANNADTGSGQYFETITPGIHFNTGRRATSGAAWSNYSNIDSYGQYLANDTGYTSTNYPHWGPMNSWTTL